MSQDYLRFKGVSDVGEYGATSQLEANLTSWIRHSLLEIGDYFNVYISSSGAYGGNQSHLRLSEAPGYTKGRVWEGFRKDWIWESGVEKTPSPIAISGVWVNGTFYPTSTSGAFAHKIDYTNGRVIFTTAIASTSTVKCEHSFRFYHVSDAEAPWFRKLQLNSFRLDDKQFHTYASGIWSIPPQNRLQLPAVVVDAVPQVVFQAGRGIGSLDREVDQVVDFHIIAENKFDRDNFHDILIAQWQKTILLFDKNLMEEQNGFPLNNDGTLSSNPKTYPQLIKPTGEGGFQWKSTYFKDMRSYKIETESPIFYCQVRAIMSTFLP